jgi:hypothetical protein
LSKPSKIQMPFSLSYCIFGSSNWKKMVSPPRPKLMALMKTRVMYLKWRPSSHVLDEDKGRLTSPPSPPRSGVAGRISLPI